MKKLLTSLLILTIFTALVYSKASISVFKGKPAWVLKITPETKKQYLDSVSAAWKKDNITLSFSDFKYSTQGKILKIHVAIEVTRNGHHASGTFSSENNLEGVEISVNDGPGVSIKGK